MVLDQVPGEVKVFHAGTTTQGGEIRTSGGRVLCVTAPGRSVQAAKQLAYLGVDKIHWPGAWSRRDIGYRAVNREQSG